VTEAALEGHLDEVQRGLLRGWAFDPSALDTRVSLVITADGELIGRVLANHFRPHLKAAGRGDGRYGFELHIVPPLSPLRAHLLAIRRERDGVHVPGSPVVLAETTGFDLLAQGQLAQLLADAEDIAAIDERLEWLAWQTETLLQHRAELDSSHHSRSALRLHQARWGSAEQASPSPGHTALVLAEAAGQQVAKIASRELHALGLDVSLAGADLAVPPPDLQAVSHRAPWIGAIEEILMRLAGHYDVVVLCDPGMAVRYAGLLRHYQPQALLVLLLDRLDHAPLAIQAHDERAPDLLTRASQVFARDRRAIGDVDVTVTRLDLGDLRRMAPQARFVGDLAEAVSPARSDTG
jgi:hypothetical protein